MIRSPLVVGRCDQSKAVFWREFCAALLLRGGGNTAETSPRTSCPAKCTGRHRPEKGLCKRHVLSGGIDVIDVRQLQTVNFHMSEKAVHKINLDCFFCFRALSKETHKKIKKRIAIREVSLHFFEKTCFVTF